MMAEIATASRAPRPAARPARRPSRRHAAVALAAMTRVAMCAPLIPVKPLPVVPSSQVMITTPPLAYQLDESTVGRYLLSHWSPCSTASFVGEQLSCMSSQRLGTTNMNGGVAPPLRSLTKLGGSGTTRLHWLELLTRERKYKKG